MHLLLLALLIAPTLGPAPTPVSARPKTLADVAAERRLGIRPPGPGTFSVAGAEGMPVLAYVAPVTSEPLLPVTVASESVVGYSYVYGVGGTRTVIVHEHGNHAHVSPAPHAAQHAAPHASGGRKR